MRSRDISGIRYGYLVAVKKVAVDKGLNAIWECHCDCGNIKNIRAMNLKNGIKSCGCKRIEMIGDKSRKHGYSKTRIHTIWQMMLQRCNNPNAENYQYYGGRGIKVCARWLVFENFLEDTKEGYASNLTLERKDTNGDYEKGNYRWATAKEQGRNKRNNHLLTADGVTATMSEWCEKVGTYHALVRQRLKRGLSEKDAIYGVK